MHKDCAHTKAKRHIKKGIVSWIWGTAWAPLQSSYKLYHRNLTISDIHILWLRQWQSNHKNAFDNLYIEGFCLFSSIEGEALLTNHTTAKKFKYAFNNCVAMPVHKAEGKVAVDSEAHRCKCYQHRMGLQSSHQDTTSTELERIILEANFLCYRKTLSLFHTDEKCPLLSNMGLRSREIKHHTS